jgi:hypothetical protein
MEKTKNDVSYFTNVCYSGGIHVYFKAGAHLCIDPKEVISASMDGRNVHVEMQSEEIDFDASGVAMLIKSRVPANLLHGDGSASLAHAGAEAEVASNASADRKEGGSP